MPEPVVTNPADEKKEPSLISQVRGKSMEQLLREEAEKRRKTAEEESHAEEETEIDEEKKKKEEDTKAASEAEEAKKKIEEDEAARKREQEIADKAASEALAKQKAAEEEERKRAEEAKTKEEAAKKREEELRPKFTGKDKDGNPVPKDYDELAAESARIGREQAIEQIRQEEAAKAAEAARKQQEEETAKAQQEAQKKAFDEQLQKELDEDLRIIYAAGDLPQVKDPKDEKDPGNMEFRHLFEIAQKVNTERLSKNLPLIRSLQVIRYGKDESGKPYYTPLKKEAPGASAPVLGSESTVSTEPSEDKYVPARDRAKTMTQMIKEEAARMSRKLNIRGN